MAYKRSRRAFEEDLRKQESPFAVYGTPLPPLDDEARDDGSYVPIWKQEVTDDRGRKRLHGAFTGGFSAGYFNTVGSKEGWTPSTFVSSRSDRAKDQKSSTHMRPEDFMDEEDIREQEESRQITTASGFAGFGTEDDPRHQNALIDLFRPLEDSMGAKLLNKMGWKQGQGIGPRIRRQTEGDTEDMETHLFAPDDVPMVTLSRKHDFKGLGFEGEASIFMQGSTPSATKAQLVAQSNDDDNQDDDGHPGLSFMARKKKPSQKGRGGFGVGVLNDTGSDDEDPYSMGPKISYNKALGSDKKGKKKAAPGFGAANPLLKKKPTFVSKKLASFQNALRKCHDGRLPLAGFVLADELDSFSTMSLNDEKYKPPEVPPGWKPARLKAESTDTTMLNQTNSTYTSTAEAAKQSSHTASSRATLLGEQKLPGKSIFDFMTPEARERLMKATGKTNLPPALSERLPGSDNNSSVDDIESTINIPQLDTVTAKAALSRADSGGFIPYAEDLDKRQRYKHFLELSAGVLPDGTSPLKPSSNVRSEDWLAELNEFVRAAEVFRPMTGAIASRFMSSSSSTLNPDGTSSAPGDTVTANGLMRKPISKPEDPAEVAAKLGMFGVMTRSVSSFQPTRLVCKRFGVDMPIYMPATTDSFHADVSRSFTSANAGVQVPMQATKGTSQSTDDGDVGIRPPSSRFQSAGFITDGRDDSTSHTELPTQTSSTGTRDLPVSSKGETTATASTTAVDPDTNEALEQARPGQAVFKAIFGDSDSDEE